jgi:hypothetical protein
MAAMCSRRMPISPAPMALRQGLTLVHSLAQRKRFLLDRGYIQGLFRECLGVAEGVFGVLGDVKDVFYFGNGSG